MPRRRLGRLRRNQDGFTLIEVLVAMTLLGLVLAALFGGLRTGVRVWDSQDRHSDALGRLIAAQGFLRRQIAEAAPLDYPAVGGGPPAAVFEGDANSVTFAGLMPSHFGLAGYQVIEVGLVRDGDGGRQLGVRWWPFDAQDPAPPAAVPEEQTAVLMDGVDGVTLSYFAPAVEGGPGQWADRWRDQPAPPDLVRIEVTFPPGDGRAWPALVVHPVLAPGAAVAGDDRGDRD